VLFTSDAAFVEGAWSPEEESQFLCVIEELARVGKTDMSARGFWVSVSKALGGTRAPKQCQNKWCSTHFNSAGLIRSKAKSETKARHGGGVTLTAIS
jgi:Myb-like DNA-binding protein